MTNFHFYFLFYLVMMFFFHRLLCHLCRYLNALIKFFNGLQKTFFILIKIRTKRPSFSSGSSNLRVENWRSERERNRNLSNHPVILFHQSVSFLLGFPNDSLTLDRIFASHCHFRLFRRFDHWSCSKNIIRSPFNSSYLYVQTMISIHKKGSHQLPVSL